MCCILGYAPWLLIPLETILTKGMGRGAWRLFRGWVESDSNYIYGNYFYYFIMRVSTSDFLRFPCWAVRCRLPWANIGDARGSIFTGFERAGHIRQK